MAEHVLPRSHKGLRLQIIVGGLTALAICLLVSFLMLIVGVRHQTFIIVTLILWPSLLALWLFGAWLLESKWDKNAYVLKKDSLLIRQKQLFSVNQELYRYEAILSVSTHQNFLGLRYGYGTIQITMPRVEQPLQLTCVIDPEKQAAAIKKAIASQGPQTQSLIS